jgi:hypothetical protein
MSSESIVYQLLQEISQLEKNISFLERQKQMKEYLVDDLRSLVDRVSEESSFLIPFKPIFEGPKLTEKVLISAKGQRKYSEESEFSSLSKCASHTTKANSVYQEDDLLWEYDNGNLILNQECSQFEGGKGNSQVQNKNMRSKNISELNCKNKISQKSLLTRTKNRLSSKLNLSIKEESHFKGVFKFWNEYLPQQASPKANY